MEHRDGIAQPWRDAGGGSEAAIVREGRLVGPVQQNDAREGSDTTIRELVRCDYGGRQRLSE